MPIYNSVGMSDGAIVTLTRSAIEYNLWDIAFLVGFFSLSVFFFYKIKKKGYFSKKPVEKGEGFFKKPREELSDNYLEIKNEILKDVPEVEAITEEKDEKVYNLNKILGED